MSGTLKVSGGASTRVSTGLSPMERTMPRIVTMPGFGFPAPSHESSIH